MTQNGTTQTINFDDGGPWTRSGATVSFFSNYLNANAYWGTFTGNGFDLSDPAAVAPSYADVLEAREGRVAMVRDFLAHASPAVLAAKREPPDSRYAGDPRSG